MHYELENGSLGFIEILYNPQNINYTIAKRGVLRIRKGMEWPLSKINTIIDMEIEMKLMCRVFWADWADALEVVKTSEV